MTLSKTSLLMSVVLAQTALAAILALVLAAQRYHNHDLYVMQQDVKKLKEAVIHQQQQDAVLRKLFTPVKTCLSSRVDFSASKTCKNACDAPLTNETVVTWDNVTVNHIGGYDAADGVFTCPTGGLYYFRVHILSVHKDIQACLRLEANGEFLASLFIDSSRGGEHEDSLLSHVVEMREGDAVRVRTTCESHVYQGDTHRHINYFMGYLISPDACLP